MSPGPPYMELEASNHLFVSPLGKPRSLVTEEVRKLSLSELSNIWTVSPLPCTTMLLLPTC